jgi:hypothetical protein
MSCSTQANLIKRANKQTTLKCQMLSMDYIPTYFNNVDNTVGKTEEYTESYFDEHRYANAYLDRANICTCDGVYDCNVCASEWIDDLDSEDGQYSDWSCEEDYFDPKPKSLFQICRNYLVDHIINYTNHLSQHEFMRSLSSFTFKPQMSDQPNKEESTVTSIEAITTFKIKLYFKNKFYYQQIVNILPILMWI